jgi:hypothetical protein
MFKLSIKERLINSTIVSAPVIIVSIILGSNLWIPFTIGAFGYQAIDHMIAHFRFK